MLWLKQTFSGNVAVDKGGFFELMEPGCNNLVQEVNIPILSVCMLEPRKRACN
jgi:hypothetical protein